MGSPQGRQLADLEVLTSAQEERVQTSLNAPEASPRAARRLTLEVNYSKRKVLRMFLLATVALQQVLKPFWRDYSHRHLQEEIASCQDRLSAQV